MELINLEALGINTYYERDVHGSVHHDIIYVNNQQDATV
jgi:hypothetical protein